MELAEYTPRLRLQASGAGYRKGKAASRLISVASGSDLVRKRMAVQN